MDPRTEGTTPRQGSKRSEGAPRAAQHAMAITIVPHDERHRDAVDAFNGRMRAGGQKYGFYVEPVPTWQAPQSMVLGFERAGCSTRSAAVMARS